ncbi:gamma-aminobutyric acid type B receptor subunit 2-like [Dreissena polymorpha]|uniref:gamma-aminobutyric acid type B receptor subunit 2-like n=1 Tax=Dreissena polymorpha TaxID=45954 RepID=UPI002264AF23|nr:gamma-aminobutyric acid type B receptor subunit 2-like [Dreissena polymorpha]
MRLLIFCRIVKMSSPNINNIILAGCSVIYISIIIQTAATTSKATCAVQLFCFWIGFATTFGSMLSKTWRVYRIFTNKKMKLNMSIRDPHLLIIIGIMVTMETIVLVVWEIYAPHEVKNQQMEIYIRTADSGEKINIIVFYAVCESEQAYYFNWTLRIMNGALLAFGAFLSWETRQVHIDALNDSKTIGLCVYNVVILSAVELLLSLLLKDKPIELHGVSSVCPFAETFVSKMLIFLKKDTFHLRRHRASQHEGLKCHVCIQCGKSFADKYLLAAHEKSEIKQGFVKCDQLGLEVRSSSDLREHAKTHMPDKCYRFDECFKTYKHKTNLSRHVRTSHTPVNGDTKS